MDHKHPNTTHGMSYSPTYQSWYAMKQRCAKNSFYTSRGITVCDSWLKFEAFFSDMGIKPIGLTLERKDNAKGYSPTNCKWATYTEQNNNQRQRKDAALYTYRNKTQSITQWCRELNLPYKTVISRLRRGWSIERALVESKRIV